MQIVKELFGFLADGRPVTRYTLRCEALRLSVLDFGAAIQQLWVPDRNGRAADVVCGFDRAEFYDADTYQGVVVGRYANRIADARFTLDGEEHHLSRNRGVHHLHGGFCGFQRRFWRVSAVEEGDEPAVSLSLHSPHGDEGYPGNLDVTVTYRLRSGGAFEICFESACDRATILNLINHVAFQLGGLSEENIRTHRLWLDADGYLPVRDLIPTGAILPVEGTIFDFRSPKPLGQDLDAPLLQKTKGYDVCLRFTEREGGGLLHRATLYHESSGREMQMYTDLPAMQLYCGNYYGDPERPFKGGIPQRIHHGVCLEAGMMPDSPNHPGFTDATLSPGEKLEHKIIFQFSVN